MSTETQVPTVCLRIGTSSIAFEEGGEVIETVEYHEDGTPDWSYGGICDERGIADAEGFRALHESLRLAEHNAQLSGLEVRRVPRETEGEA
jgi:hypothetical protein